MSRFTDNDPPHSYLKNIAGQFIILAILPLIGFLVSPVEALSPGNDISPKNVIVVNDLIELSSIGLNTFRPITSVYFLDENGLNEEESRFILKPNTEPTTILALVTAYNATVEQCDDTPFITASGERVREGIVACPIRFPFGSLIEIDDKIYECQDRMGFAHQNANKFDIFMWSLSDARTWGSQWKNVNIF